MRAALKISIVIFANLALLPIFAYAQASSTLLPRSGTPPFGNIQPANPTLQNPVISGCPNIIHALSRGSRGMDVAAVQKYLISQNLLGSDSATGYFGALTERAIQQWQAKKSLVSSGSPATTGFGAVGPRTRAALRNCISANPSSTARTPGTIAPPVGTVSPNSPITNPGGYTGGGGGYMPSPPSTPPQNPSSPPIHTPPPPPAAPVPPSTPPSDTLSKPSVTVIAPISQSKMYFNDWTVSPIMNAEETPWALGSARMGGWHSFLISTARTYFCSTPDNMFALTSEKSVKDMQTCHFKEGAALNAGNAVSANALPMWKRDYYAAFSGHILKTGANDWTAYMINHGEMENDDPAVNPESGLSSCVPAPDMGYGTLPCTAANWWPSYNAFIGMASFPWTQAGLGDNGSLTTDYGPITWPSNGYIESKDGGATWIKATDGGVRHPSSIVANGYLYVFYEDLSQGSESDGRGPGIKVMRAPITSSGIDPRSFRMYYSGDFTDAALPPGYDISNYSAKWSVKGGRANNLFPANVMTAQPTPGTRRTDQRRVSDVINFSVAKVNGTDWYLGVANDLSKGVTLRLSKDLIHWSEPTVVPGTESNYWTSSVDLQRIPLLYPRLANADGDSNTDIDPTDFYIIGTQTAPHGGSEAKVANVIHLKLNL